MGQPLQLADEVARRILTSSYGRDIGERSQLFTDLAEMIRRQIEGEKLVDEWNPPKAARLSTQAGMPIPLEAEYLRS